MANKIILNAFFPGEPTTWKRAGGRGRTRFTPEAMRTAQINLRWQFKAIAPNMKVDEVSRFGFQATFQISRRGDGDNFEKLILDAFEGFIWENDEQVDEGQWRKDRSKDKPPGIHLIVYTISAET